MKGRSMIFTGDNRIELQHCIYGTAAQTGRAKSHNGQDIDTTGRDRNIHSTTDGTVMQSTIITNKSNLTWEWGHYVCVRDTQGYQHYYCHMASRAVVVGQKVTKGMVLGVMGKTGNAAGDRQAEHVHYEVRRYPYGGANHLNPSPWSGVPNRVGTVINQAEDKGGVVYMKALDVFALGKKNIQGFSKPDINAVVANHIPDGRYMVYSYGMDIGGGLKGAQVRYAGQKVYIAILAGYTEITDISVADAQGRWRWFEATAGIDPAEHEKALLAAKQAAAERDKAQGVISTIRGVLDDAG